MNTTEREAIDGPGGLCTRERRTFEVEAYRDSNGAPACCVDWDTARCRFVVTRRFGTLEACSATGADLLRLPADTAPGAGREDYILLRPVAECPVWYEPEYNADGSEKHIACDGARFHVVSYHGNGLRCSEKNCEINKRGSSPG